MKRHASPNDSDVKSYMPPAQRLLWKLDVEPGAGMTADCGEAQYPNRVAAATVANYWERRSGGSVVIRCCRWCGGWHWDEDSDPVGGGKNLEKRSWVAIRMGNR